MKMKWKLFGMIFCLAALLVMPQLALADVTESLIVNGEDILTAADNTVQCGEGTAKYDPATKTLTLKNAAISEGNVAYDRLIEAKGIDLNIVLMGENTLDGSAAPHSAGIYVLAGNLNISGQTGSKLDINVGDSNGISVRKSNIEDSSVESYNLYIDGAVVNVESTGNAVYVDGKVEIKNSADVTAKADEYVGIYGKDGVMIDHANVNAASKKHNAINSEKSVEIKNGADITANSYYPGIFGSAGVVIAGAAVDTTSTEDVGIFSPVKVEIKANADVTAHGDLDGISSNGSLVISGSEVKAFSARQSGIYSMQNMSITENADVTAEGLVNGIEVYGGDLLISGSTVKARATSADEADAPNGIVCNGGDIVINSNSNITAQGFLSGIYSSGKLSISGGNVEATSTGDVALCSDEAFEIKDNAEVTAVGFALGISSNNNDVLISDSTVNAISTREQNEDNNNGTGIWALGKVDITNSVVNAKAAFGYGILAERTVVKDQSDVTAQGTDKGISCAKSVEITGGSKVKATGETGIVIDPGEESGGDKGCFYVYGSWVDTSGKADSRLMYVNSVFIEDGIGTVDGIATVPDNAVIAAGQTLTVAKGETLTIPKGSTLTIDQGGKLIIAEGGKVVKQQGATLTNNGTVEGSITEGSSGGSGGGGGGSSIGNQDKDTDKDPDKKDDVVKSNNPFADIKNDQWFYDDVMFVYEKGLMNGASDNKFDPSGTATRGMLATILWRQAGSPAAEGKNSYNDVPAGRYYTDAIRWATEKGVYTGFGGGVFRPDEQITREQLAAVLYRYAKFQGADVSKTGDIAGFSDAGKVSAWAQEPLKWAVGNGIVNGQGNNTLSPQGMAQRADIAAMLHRFLDKFSK